MFGASEAEFSTPSVGSIRIVCNNAIIWQNVLDRKVCPNLLTHPDSPAMVLQRVLDKAVKLGLCE